MTSLISQIFVVVSTDSTLGAKLLAPTLCDLLRTDSSELDDFMWKSALFFSPLRSSPLRKRKLDDETQKLFDLSIKLTWFSMKWTCQPRVQLCRWCKRATNRLIFDYTAGCCRPSWKTAHGPTSLQSQIMRSPRMCRSRLRIVYRGHDLQCLVRWVNRQYRWK